MGGGVIVARRAIAQLTDIDATPERSIRELESDRKWLRADG
jgi:hypothetical protein